MQPTANRSERHATDRERFFLFAEGDYDVAALLATAEETRNPLAYGVLADKLAESGEDAWATYFRSCVGSEWAVEIDGSTYVTRAVSGYKGRTVYEVVRTSPRMRNSFGQAEYCYSASALVLFFAVAQQRADAKTGRKAKERDAKAAARKQPNPFAVGDLLHYSFGYDATINTFAQVVAVSGQTVTIRRINAAQVGDGWATGCKVRPVPGCFHGDAETSRLAYSAYGEHVGVSLPVADHKGKHWKKCSADETFYETDNR